MKKNRLRGKLKGWFFAMRLHNMIPSGISAFLSQLSRLSGWINSHRSLSSSDFYTPSFDYSRRYGLYSHLVEAEKINYAVDYLEFGVAGGLSFRWWSEHLSHPGCRLYGFDTFTGLPEDWGDFRKGDMSTGSKPPEIADSRCSFRQGLFQQSLPGFLKVWSPQERKIIHMDADLYTSTLFVLTSISPFLNKGDILIFDEFNVPMHEFKAFTEWTQSFYINYEVLAAVNNFYQVAFRIV